MTILLTSAVAHGKSKAVLEDALRRTPALVVFEDPSIFSGSRKNFTGADITAGDHFALVMDPLTRRRFAQVICKVDGSFRVR